MLENWTRARSERLRKGEVRQAGADATTGGDNQSSCSLPHTDRCSFPKSVDMAKASFKT